ncbi:response regulator transcription factor [Herbivorax sp. ANBcel31]|uniref:response regulator transcription factor n=1 Tax=Herbivorax sp. ANBcel31 TaxID=3069754 RepID=UPI0027B0488E|nr:response regulator transcription factor [Herbivorax sp. ANBcel31]MDQ2085414.1 response regulator transcription factor [Herbivorax sp. ANBcel31]
MIKVIIVDDQIILRESLKFIIEQDSDIEVVGLAGNGKEALSVCEQLSPDVVLMDIMMPQCDGVEGTELIKSKYDKIKVIILTTFNDEENVSKAIKNGADGYVLKDISPDELILAVKSVFRGFSIMHHSTLSTFAGNKEKSNKKNKKSVKTNGTNVRLSKKELKILNLIVDGKNNKEIAKEMFITEGTVKNAISQMLDKLDLKDRTQLAVFAVKNNIL